MGSSMAKVQSWSKQVEGSAAVSIIPLPSSPAALQSQLRSTAQQRWMNVIIYLHPFDSDDPERGQAVGDSHSFPFSQCEFPLPKQ